jgi:choline transport protein
MSITEFIYQATGSWAAAVVLTIMLTVCFINGMNGTNVCVTSASRLLSAIARDNAIPLSKLLSVLDPRPHAPEGAITFCFVFNVFIGILYLGPSVAFNAYGASTTISLNIEAAAGAQIPRYRAFYSLPGTRLKKSMHEVVSKKLGGIENKRGTARWTRHH